MAQPEGLPERMIAATADAFHASFLDAWGADDQIMPMEVRARYLEHDRADRAAGTKLAMPVASMAQDWGGQLGFDPEALWRAWASDFAFHPIAAGHFMAESHPREVTQFVRSLLAR